MNNAVIEPIIQINNWGDFWVLVIGAIVMSPMIIAAWYQQNKNKKGGT